VGVEENKHMSEIIKATIKEKRYNITKLFGAVSVTAECVDDEDGFRFRLKAGDFETPWTVYYEGVLVLEYGVRKFGFATHYWAGVLPIEEPFEIVQGK
jgi:hypothetical protein